MADKIQNLCINKNYAECLRLLPEINVNSYYVVSNCSYLRDVANREVLMAFITRFTDINDTVMTTLINNPIAIKILLDMPKYRTKVIAAMNSINNVECLIVLMQSKIFVPDHMLTNIKHGSEKLRLVKTFGPMRFSGVEGYSSIVGGYINAIDEGTWDCKSIENAHPFAIASYTSAFKVAIDKERIDYLQAFIEICGVEEFKRYCRIGYAITHRKYKCTEFLIKYTDPSVDTHEKSSSLVQLCLEMNDLRTLDLLIRHGYKFYDPIKDIDMMKYIGTLDFHMRRYVWCIVRNRYMAERAEAGDEMTESELVMDRILYKP